MIGQNVDLNVSMDPEDISQEPEKPEIVNEALKAQNEMKERRKARTRAHRER